MPGSQIKIQSSSAGIKCFTAALLLFSLVPAIALVPRILHSWVNIPYWDDWITPGHQLLKLLQGKLTIGELFSPHNQSRPFFPRLVLIPLDWWGWDVRKAMSAIFLMVCAASFLLFRLLGRLRCLTMFEKPLLFLLINAVLFWPNSEIWTFENTFMMVWPPAMLLCALLVNLSGVSFRKKVFLNSFLATVATYSWANGMLLWIFALPLPATAFSAQGFRDAEAKWYRFYGLACAINLGFYFYGLPHAGLSWNAPAVLDYFFIWLGGFFGDFRHARFLGLCVFALYAVLAGGHLYIASKRREFSGGYPWLVLGAYAIASGIMTAMGRIQFGMEQAMSPRYTAVSGYLYIAIIGLGYLAWSRAYREWAPKKAHLTSLAAIVLAGLMAPAVVHGYKRGAEYFNDVHVLRKTVLSAWQWSKVMPGNAGLSLMYPSGELGHWGTELENNHVLRVERWSPEVSANWNFNQDASAANNDGVLNICNIEPGVNRFVVEGWSRLPGREGPADYVLITLRGSDGITRPFLMLPADNRVRPDVVAALGDKHMLHSGFRQDVAAETLPAGRLTVTAWAVDMEHGTIAPLANPRILEARGN